MKTENILLLGGGAAAIYFVLSNKKIKEQINKATSGFKLPSFNLAFPDISMPSFAMPSFDWVADIMATATEGVTGFIDTAKNIIPNPMDLVDKAKGLLPKVVTTDKPTSDYQVKWGLAGKPLEDYTTKVYLPFGIAIGKEPNIFLDFFKTIFKFPFQVVGTVFKAGYEVSTPMMNTLSPIGLNVMNANIARTVVNAVSSGGGRSRSSGGGSRAYTPPEYTVKDVFGQGISTQYPESYTSPAPFKTAKIKDMFEGNYYK